MLFYNNTIHIFDAQWIIGIDINWLCNPNSLNTFFDLIMRHQTSLPRDNNPCRFTVIAQQWEDIHITLVSSSVFIIIICSARAQIVNESIQPKKGNKTGKFNEVGYEAKYDKQNNHRASIRWLIWWKLSGMMILILHHVESVLSWIS